MVVYSRCTGAPGLYFVRAALRWLRVCDVTSQTGEARSAAAVTCLSYSATVTASSGLKEPAIHDAENSLKLRLNAETKHNVGEKTANVNVSSKEESGMRLRGKGGGSGWGDKIGVSLPPREA